MRARPSSYPLFFDPSACHSGANRSDIDETIRLYYEIYIIPNLDRLATVETPDTIKERLDTAKKLEKSNFDSYLNDVYGDNEDNYPIKAIYQVFRSLITGELDQKDPLMEGLLRVNSNLSMADLNQAICNRVFQLITSYLNQLHSKPSNNTSG